MCLGYKMIGPGESLAVLGLKVEGCQCGVDRDGLFDGGSPVKIKPLPIRRHAASAQVESRIQKTVKAFSNRRGCLIGLHDRVEILDTG